MYEDWNFQVHKFLYDTLWDDKLFGYMQGSLIYLCAL